MDVVHDRARIIAKADRISNLPNEIIHHILSFIDMKYAIQTSSLSKKWKHIWTSMPCLNLNSRTFRTSPRFAKFVNDAISHRNHRTQVSAVELSFRGAGTEFAALVTSIVFYAYSHNVRRLTLVWFRLNREPLQFPQRIFSSRTLKHLILATNYYSGSGLSLPKLAWDFPALETLNLSNLSLSDDGDKSLNLFSKCVNLKDLTLHKCYMGYLDIFYIYAPRLSNLTITDPSFFPKVFNVVAPQLENLTAWVSDIPCNFLQLSTEGLDFLEKVDLSMRSSFVEKESFAPGLLDLFQKLCRAKFLILDMGIIQVLSACLDQLSDEPCPFNNLTCLKQKDGTKEMPTQVRNYLLQSSPNATFSMDLPQALFSCTNQLSHEPSQFNNLKCLNQTECIPRMSIEVKNQLLESSPSATFDMDSPQVPHKRSRQEADNGTMANTLEEGKKQKNIVDEEKRMLEAKICMQDEVIAKQKTMLEAMKVQHEKGMLEAKIHMQDKIITEQKKVMLEITARQKKAMLEITARQKKAMLEITARQKKAMLEITAQQKKAMLETTKLLHENGTLEEKMQMQDKVIAEQKVMLETMKLQNEKKMFEAKIHRQDKIIAEQKVMLEAMKLQHDKIEKESGNIDS